MRFGFENATARASVDCYQLAAFDIKLLVFIHHPLMKAIFTQCFAFIFVFQGWLFESYNISHTKFLRLSVCNIIIYCFCNTKSLPLTMGSFASITADLDLIGRRPNESICLRDTRIWYLPVGILLKR